jgi:hypothetical protein
MYFLLSGEGPTDMGTGRSASISEGEDFRPGPMAAIVDRVVAVRWEYSILETDGLVGLISERALATRAAELKAAKKSIRIPGVRTKKETRYFFNSARILAKIARELKNDDVIAVLFRDSDGTASAGRGLWADKHASMLDGFAEEGFANGVPMLPKPKSEAWLLCALNARPYQNCDKLEERSGNDAAPNSLKNELAGQLDRQVTSEYLCSLVLAGEVDVDRIKMPSFAVFRNRLESLL